jgi:predicted amidophosphoribosyltransferase
LNRFPLAQRPTDPPLRFANGSRRAQRGRPAARPDPSWHQRARHRVDWPLARPRRLSPRAVACGLYLPSFERGHSAHALTQKIRRSKHSREHDLVLAELIARVAMLAFPEFEADVVASVPTSRGPDRFGTIRVEVARHFGATSQALLEPTRVVEGYRQMTRAQRRQAADGIFAARRPIRGKRVLLVDDVVTSGAKACDATRAVALAGAGDWRFVAIGRAISAPGDRLDLAHRGCLPSMSTATRRAARIGSRTAVASSR